MVIKMPVGDAVDKVPLDGEVPAGIVGVAGALLYDRDPDGLDRKALDGRSRHGAVLDRNDRHFVIKLSRCVQELNLHAVIIAGSSCPINSSHHAMTLF